MARLDAPANINGIWALEPSYLGPWTLIRESHIPMRGKCPYCEAPLCDMESHMDWRCTRTWTNGRTTYGDTTPTSRPPLSLACRVREERVSWLCTQREQKSEVP